MSRFSRELVRFRCATPAEPKALGGERLPSFPPQFEIFGHMNMLRLLLHDADDDEAMLDHEEIVLLASSFIIRVICSNTQPCQHLFCLHGSSSKGHTAEQTIADKVVCYHSHQTTTTAAVLFRRGYDVYRGCHAIDTRHENRSRPV